MEEPSAGYAHAGNIDHQHKTNKLISHCPWLCLFLVIESLDLVLGTLTMKGVILPTIQGQCFHRLDALSLPQATQLEKSMTEQV